MILKKTLIISAVMSLFLSGCSVGDISISKRENPAGSQTPQIVIDEANVSNNKPSTDNTSSSNNNLSTNEQSNYTFPEVPKSANVGERFCVVAAAESGHLYLTLNKCEVYDNLNDAGVEYDELQHSVLIDGFNYNSQTTELLDENKMIMIHMTVENVNAVSAFHKEIPDHFGEYDFSVLSLGNVPGASLEYLDSRLKDDLFYDILHIEPGETKNIIVGFVIPTNYESLEEAVFTNGDEHSLTPYTAVNLEMGE